MVQTGVFFCQAIAFALLGNDMQKLRAGQAANVAECINQHRQVMTINRTNVVEAEFFKQGAGCNHAFNVFFGSFCQFQHRGDVGEHFFAGAARSGIKTTRHQF